MFQDSRTAIPDLDPARREVRHRFPECQTIAPVIWFMLFYPGSER